ncbi:MAG: ribonuclease J [Clostridia bacterium]|nr:ribonuclease J [Clostridia bacterium]
MKSNADAKAKDNAKTDSSNKKNKKKKSNPTETVASAMVKPAEKLSIAFLGGMNEIGKNLTMVKYGNDCILIDCGIAFPDAEMFGVDLVIPDFSYIERNKENILGIFITHGHEDHIGGLPYLLRNVNVPIYATCLTCGLIEGKLSEHHLLNAVSMHVISPGDVIALGDFLIEAIHVNHSIPDALGFAIKTPAGTIVHTGDFKIDTTPIDGGMIDVARLAQLGNEGVLCLLSDSTNAERPGFTASEKNVGESLEMLFRKAGKKRIIVASFASNIHRIQQIMDCAVKLGRKVALSGRSLENVVRISTDLGYLNIPDTLIVPIERLKNYTDEQIIIITTGSQGEPMSALSRMAMSDHRRVTIGANDCVVISATPIPGNEKTVGNIINELMKLGADVFYERNLEIHVSGHASQEELKMMMCLLRPKYFIPVHGEQKHLQKHARLAESIGIPKDNILVADIGMLVELSDDRIAVTGNVPAGRLFVDGSGIGDVGNTVLRDRKRLSQDGIVVVTAVLDAYSGEVIAPIDVQTKGFVYVKESAEIVDGIADIALAAADSFADAYSMDVNALKAKMRDYVSKAIYEKTKRNPVIIPVVLMV